MAYKLGVSHTRPALPCDALLNVAMKGVSCHFVRHVLLTPNRKTWQPFHDCIAVLVSWLLLQGQAGETMKYDASIFRSARVDSK